MSNERDSIIIYRMQGSIDVLDTLITIPGTAKNYIAGLASGAMKDISKTINKEN